MNRLFEETGAHVLVDGQFGSTGKGNLASFLAQQAYQSGAIWNFDGVVTNNGPNSGHTSYYGQEKIVLKQLPTFAIHAHMMGATMPVYLTAGAVIDPDVLFAEAKRYPKIPIWVHPNAAVVAPEDKQAELDPESPQAKIASTQSGTGSAIARKILRNPSAIAATSEIMHDLPDNVRIAPHRLKPEENAYFVEVPQGFSLGINSEFYPHCTSRECTVMQAITDARIPPRMVTKTYMCVRTFPIRVGNLGENSSGDWYSDQEEMTWEDVGVNPELTTVTQRIRRVASFSLEQFYYALRANDPDWVALTFLDYTTNDQMRGLLEDIKRTRESIARKFDILGSFGPKSTQWKILP